MAERVAFKRQEYLRPSELKHIFVPAVTPFMRADGLTKVDVESQRRHITNLVQNGVDGIFLGSNSGQGRDMDLANLKISVMEGLKAARTVNPEIPVVVGALRQTLREIIDMARFADKIGADAVVVAPLYAIGDLDNVFNVIHANTNSIPLILDNNPKFQDGANLPFEFIRDIQAYDKVIGIKDSSGDERYFSYLLKKFRTDNKHVMQGDTKAGLSPGILDADGIVPVEANVFTQAFLDLFKKTKIDFDPTALQEIMDLMARNKEDDDGSVGFIKSLLVQGGVFQSDIAFPTK